MLVERRQQIKRGEDAKSRDRFAGEFGRVRKRDRRDPENQRDSRGAPLRRAEKSREAKHHDAQRRGQQSGREDRGQVSCERPVQILVIRVERQQHVAEDQPRKQRGVGRAGRFDRIDAPVKRDDVGGVVAAKIVDPQRVLLEHRAHQVEAARDALIGALVKVRVGDERDQEDRGLELPDAIRGRDSAAGVRGAGRHRLFGRPAIAVRNRLKMRKSSSP